MSRVTVAQLVERLEAMQAEIDALRAQVEAPSIQYVRELSPPAPISQPLDVHELAAHVNWQHSHYDEDGDVYGPNLYL